MSDFSTHVHALSAAARELRLSLLDNQAKVTWIDAYSHTHLLEDWKNLREDYRRMLDESESTATRLATAITSYVDLQEYMNDASMLDDLVEEFEGLNENLTNMRVHQENDLDGLTRSVDNFGQDIDPLLKVHTAPVEDHVGAGRDASTGSLQEPTMHAIASLYLNRVWGRSNHGNRKSATPTGPLSSGTSDMLANGQPAAGVTGIQAMPAVLQMIRNNLETQKRLSRIVLAEMKDKLAHEIQTYLTALRNTQAVASPENQLALRNATRRVSSSTEAWRERAKLLTDGYAKVPK